jgi:hypothetical protein
MINAAMINAITINAPLRSPATSKAGHRLRSHGRRGRSISQHHAPNHGRNISPLRARSPDRRRSQTFALPLLKARTGLQPKDTILVNG